MNRLNETLDRTVSRLHDLKLFGVDVHPYLLFLDTGVLLSLLLIPVYSRVIVPIDVPVYAGIFLLLVVSYERVYTDVKERLLSTKERNFPLDALVYLLPVGLALVYLAGLDVGPIAALAAMQLALSNGFTRIGCFSGGCCYGKDSPIGVRYPDEIFVEHDGRQAFSPGTNPESRVFPCQLTEMVAQFGLLVAVSAYLLAGNEPGFGVLVGYLCAYSAFRFLNDFTRQYTHRPTYGPLTEGQVIAVVVMVAGGAYLLS